MPQKSSVLTFDDLVTITADFYTSDEVKGAVTSVYAHIDQRPPAYKSVDKDRKAITDILKLVLNPQVKLPTYVAVDISRLPPVAVEHLDTSALLQELALLRSEVPTIGAVRAELDEVKSTLKAMQQSTLPCAAPAGVSSRGQSSSVSDGGAGGVGGDGAVVSVPAAAASFAAKARDHQRTGVKEKKKPVMGLSTTNRHVKNVETVRTVNIFVSRLHPSTAGSELVDCVNTVKGDLNVKDIKCEKLSLKYEHLYSSFHVAVCVSSMQFKAAIDLFSSAEAWPMGVFVERYFLPRNVVNSETESSEPCDV